jgi:hypothetical protein
MAVIQISKIQVRRGFQENLPQLGSGELGWSIDARRLFIGNGTLSEGAPEIGNTEILTIYSPIGAALGNLAVIENEIIAITANVAQLQGNAYSNSTLITLYDSVASPTSTALALNATTTNLVNYSIIRGTSSRVGIMKVTAYSGSVVFEDDYSETADTGILLSFQASGGVATMYYTSTNQSGVTAAFKYNLKTFI